MDIPRNRRLIPSLYRLEGSRCSKCGTLAYPSRYRCAECGSTDAEPHAFAARGRLLSFSEVFKAPRDHATTAPYIVGLVRLDEGVTVAAQLADVRADELSIGQRVEGVFRRVGDVEPHGLIVYVTKFRPAVDTNVLPKLD